MISVIISTLNRPEKLHECLKKILASDVSDFEVIVVDQSKGYSTKSVVKQLGSPKIVYSKMNTKGKSKGLNDAVKRASGELLAFTDDDCLVDKHWLNNIHRSLQENKNIVGVFGQVLPHEPLLNKGKLCPGIFISTKERTITKPTPHWKYIGFGNNMAFKKEVFRKTGLFKEWLGPSAIGLAAEDAEFAQRVLLSGFKILRDPKVKVYHNRWLTKKEFQKQMWAYSCGELACYGYFAMRGEQFAKKIVSDNFRDSYKKLKGSIKSLLHFQRSGVKQLYNTSIEFFFRLRGLSVGYLFFKKESQNQ